jgi:hypothetical protein
MKYRKTVCLKVYNEFPDMKFWGFQPVDMRKKYFTCINCKEEHLVSLGVVTEKDIVG